MLEVVFPPGCAARLQTGTWSSIQGLKELSKNNLFSNGEKEMSYRLIDKQVWVQLLSKKFVSVSNATTIYDLNEKKIKALSVTISVECFALREIRRTLCRH